MPEQKTRPTVDLVVPFVGSDDALARLLDTLGGVQLGDADRLIVVDNGAESRTRADDRVVAAPDVQSSYYARNAGAAEGSAPWIVFLDADVRPAPDVVEAYQLATVPDDVGFLAGRIIDDDPRGKPEDGLGARYNHARSSLGNDLSERDGFFYGKTANVAVRRAAFEAIGGFRGDLRSGGDAEICFRMRDAGWVIAKCEKSCVDHVGRASVVKVLRQMARYGSGARWLDDHYPGFSPEPGNYVRYIGGAVRLMLRAVPLAVRGHREEAAFAVLDGAASLAYLVGRRVSNVVS
ncbi:MAG: glycosyltransferase family 2 protein [Beijerinckiaceae bacterium]|nr:glycosyltransferase family 2 protein [Beijerinckiaceae bacterium]